MITWKAWKAETNLWDALIAGMKERWLYWLTSPSSIHWAKNIETICYGPVVEYAMENWPEVWGLNCYWGLFLLSPFLSVAFCVFSLFSDSPLFVITSWLSEVPGANPSFNTSEREQESFSQCSYHKSWDILLLDWLCHILGPEQWPGWLSDKLCTFLQWAGKGVLSRVLGWVGRGRSPNKY